MFNEPIKGFGLKIILGSNKLMLYLTKVGLFFLQMSFFWVFFRRSGAGGINGNEFYGFMKFKYKEALAMNLVSRIVGLQ